MNSARGPHESDSDSRQSGIRRRSATASSSSISHHGASSSGGLSLTVAFVLSVGLAVTIATLAAAALNYFLAVQASRDAIVELGTSAAVNAAAASTVVWSPDLSKGSFSVRNTIVQPARLTRRGATVDGIVFRTQSQDPATGQVKYHEIVADSPAGSFQASMLASLLLSSAVVIGVGVAVAFLLSRRVVGPITALAEDIRVLSHGNLDHRVRVQAGGELGLLAKSVDRMIRDLRDAQDAEREREKHEHELEVAAEIRSSLLPEKTPDLPGYELAAHGAAADSIGGDLYDFVERSGETSALAIVVAGISARGVPGAMLMTMARAYLHHAFERESAPGDALKAANRPITRDMRRGLFVTALAAVIEPETGRVRVSSAGHKAPLLHWVAASKSLRQVHPEGIALGFDAGPVFDRTVRELDFVLAPGDRMVLTSAGAFSIQSPEGLELGEKGFFEIVGKHAPKTSEAFCQLVGSEVDRFRGDVPLADDVVLLTVRRKSAGSAGGGGSA